MSKYWIALSILATLALASSITYFIMRHREGWSRSITLHLVFIAFMFGTIITLKQITLMLLEQYDIVQVTPTMVNTIAVFAMTILAMQQMFQLINRLTHSHIKNGSDVTDARMVARILKMMIFLAMLLLFGEHFGLSLSGLLAFGGIGGIAIGLAGKDMLSNLFSGVMLYFDRSFSIGDWISSPDRVIEGTVVEIGWRITKIMTFDNRPLYVPNAAFSTITVINPGHMTNRRITTTVTLRYSDADKVALVVNDIRAMLANNKHIDQTQSLLVYFDAFADSSLNIMVYCFTKTTVWADWLSIQQDVFLKIIKIVHSHGADFAFKSESIYIEPSSNELVVSTKNVKTEPKIVSPST